MHPGGPVTADVHPDEVENWKACGWHAGGIATYTSTPGPEMPLPGDPPASLDTMGVKELRAYAKEHGIAIGAKATTKDAILAVISAAVGESSPPASA